MRGYIGWVLMFVVGGLEDWKGGMCGGRVRGGC